MDAMNDAKQLMAMLHTWLCHHLNISIANVHYSREYIFSTLPINDIQPSLQSALLRLAHSLMEILIASAFVVFYFGLLAAKLLTLGFPHMVSFGKLVVEFHRTQLTTSDMLIEAASLSVIVLSFVFKKQIIKVSGHQSPHFFLNKMKYLTRHLNLLLYTCNSSHGISSSPMCRPNPKPLLLLRRMSYSLDFRSYFPFLARRFSLRLSHLQACLSSLSSSLSSPLCKCSCTTPRSLSQWDS